jgi:large subunit ribosomal protein L24
MSKWIRQGDHVKVMAGNDKGKVGRVLKKYQDYATVEGVNIRKRHFRKGQQSQQGGRVVEMEMPIHISNVMLCTEGGETFRLSVQQSGSGEKKLVTKKAGLEQKIYRLAKERA